MGLIFEQIANGGKDAPFNAKSANCIADPWNSHGNALPSNAWDSSVYVIYNTPGYDVARDWSWLILIRLEVVDSRLTAQTMIGESEGNRDVFHTRLN